MTFILQNALFLIWSCAVLLAPEGESTEENQTIAEINTVIQDQQSGVIISSNYPQNYSKSRQAMWWIKVPNNTGLHLNFVEVNSIVQLWNWNGDQITNLEPFDGFNSGLKINAPGSVLIKFNGPDNQNNKRFKLEFNQVQRMESTMNAIDSSGISSSCWQVIHSGNGTVMSPNYPNHYHANARCVWVFDPANDNSFVKINFLDFEVEDGYFDFVELWTMEGDKFNFRERYQQRTPPPETSLRFSSTVLLLFYTDHSIGKSGFHLDYDFKRQTDSGIGLYATTTKRQTDSGIGLYATTTESNVENMAKTMLPNFLMINQYFIWIYMMLAF